MKYTFNHWLFGISILLVGASLFLNISKTVITNESIVLTFIGVIATFVVVGNYAQVNDIKNDTDNKIRTLESKTQSQIEELKKMLEEVKLIKNDISNIEKDIFYNAAEAYRLYAIFAYDKEFYKTSTTYLIKAARFYLKSSDKSQLDTVLDTIISNLKESKWNDPDLSSEFNYESKIKIISEFPDDIKQKKEIILLLKKMNNVGK